MNIQKILLIEDEPLIQRSLKKLLEKRNVIVFVESNGKQAIERILSEDFDRIICDLMLQDVSGFDIIEDAKKKYSLSEISKVFIIITAYSSNQVLEKAQSYGCKVLSKPFLNIEEAIDTFVNP